MKTTRVWAAALCVVFLGLGVTGIADAEDPARPADGEKPAATKVAKQDGAETIVIEDCEDVGKTALDRWKRVGWARVESVEYVFDQDRQSRVIEFKAKPTPYVAKPLNKESFARFIDQKYPIKVDELTAKLQKAGIIEQDGENFRFPPRIMVIPDRYQFLDVLKKLPDKLTDDELTVAVAVWARRHMIRQPRYSLKIEGCKVVVLAGMEAKFDKFILGEKDALPAGERNHCYTAPNGDTYVNQSSGVHLDTLRVFNAEGKHVRQAWPPNLNRPVDAVRNLLDGKWGATDWDGDGVPIKICHNSWYLVGVNSAVGMGLTSDK